MIPVQIATSSVDSLSNVITDVLGIVAVCAFFAIACYILFQVIRTPHRKPTFAPSSDWEPPARSTSLAARSQKQCEADAMEKLVEDLGQGHAAILESGRPKLEELSQLAADVFRRIAGSYAAHSYGYEGEDREFRAKRFGTVCERQWGFMRSEIGYLSFLDIQERLRHILEHHRMLDTRNHGPNELADTSPDLLRSQEMVSLMRVVSRDRVRSLQSDLLDAVRDFGRAFDGETKAWLNHQIVKLTKDLRRKAVNGVSISDTEYADKYKQLRSRFEIIARLADRVSQNTQQIGEPSLVLSQVIYVGTVLRILASMPEWLDDFELAPTVQMDAEEEGVSSSSTGGSSPAASER